MNLTERQRKTRDRDKQRENIETRASFEPCGGGVQGVNVLLLLVAARCF